MVLSMKMLVHDNFVALRPIESIKIGHSSLNTQAHYQKQSFNYTTTVYNVYTAEVGRIKEKDYRLSIYTGDLQDSVMPPWVQWS